MILLRLLAAAIAALSVFPLWRILPDRATGLAGTATAQAAASCASLMWSGVLLAVIPGMLAAVLFEPRTLESDLRRLIAPLARVPALTWALLCALLTTVTAGVVAIKVLHGLPTLIDSFAQLTQARYFAAGQLAGPVSAQQEFWHIQQTILTPHGWVAQYPPGYAALLALGFVFGLVQWVGPFWLAVAVFFTALIADEVFDDRVLARVAALLAAVSPFMVGMAGAYMSHVPACAFSAATLYFVLRAQRGSSWWALAGGVCVGALFAIRPLTAVVAATVAWLYAMFSPLSFTAKTRRVSVAALGALPFVVLVGWYNAHFFGHASTFGYVAALGSDSGLGFGVDPWGNRFGPVESLAYTSAELSALSVFLLEVPLPLMLFTGLHFALEPQRSLKTTQQYLLFAWVAGLLLASFFYWHHGLFMGPRMLADVGTLWVLLAVLGTAGLIARIPDDRTIVRKYSLRVFVLGGVLVQLVLGLCYLGPTRLLSYAPSLDLRHRLIAPQIRGAALVFVHGGWSARVGMRLAGRGMRLDSIETALRQNSTCAVDRFSRSYPHLPATSRLDFTPRSTNLPTALELSPGNRIRVVNGEVFDSTCIAEARSDRGGVVDVTPYMWQGDLPGLKPSGPMFVRDMGPADNAALIKSQPQSVPLMVLVKNGRTALEPYNAGFAARWGVGQ